MRFESELIAKLQNEMEKLAEIRGFRRRRAM